MPAGQPAEVREFAARPRGCRMTQQIRVRSNVAIAGWIFMAIWFGGVAMMTYVFLRDGGFRQFNPLLETGVVLLFWVFGLAGCAEMFSKPRTDLEIRDGGGVLVERWLLRRSVTRFGPETLRTARLVRHADSDGDSYECRLTLADGRMTAVKQSPVREDIEALVEQIHAAA